MAFHSWACGGAEFGGWFYTLTGLRPDTEYAVIVGGLNYLYGRQAIWSDWDFVVTPPAVCR